MNRHLAKTFIATGVSAVTIAGFSTPTFAAPLSAATSVHSKDFLMKSAQETWEFFVKATDNPTGLPADRIDVANGSFTPATDTSPTNIAMYMMSIVAAKDLNIINQHEASVRMRNLIHELNSLDKWNGFLYNWYNTADGTVNTQKNGHFVSTVDDGWFAAGLVVAREAFPQYKSQLSALLNAMDFSRLYDASYKQLYGGYDADSNQMQTWHYGNINTESRVADYIAIGQGHVPETLWWGVYRTLPSDWTWQNQIPAGTTVIHDGVPVFEGHYSLNGVEYVPSWGGSMFEALMPTLVLDEKDKAPNGLGLNDERMVDLQIEYAKQKNYPVWGISPCALPDDGYGVYGVPGLGTVNYDEDGTITPHASFLALQFEPQLAVQNLQTMASKYPAIIGPFGYYDSVNVRTSKVADSYLALDEGMIMVSLDNSLKRGAIQKDFAKDPIGQKPQHLLAEENFMIN
ncbi:glucoamylase family protein [Alicyclobacillus pomorum]|uniref:glucoamylase family protein n=1 Tax=Alicyclobacillus pomorum TaxID=204470 RepID=UPI000418CF1B|nr:glucoamylase family protein [Alicyclobacillus pomorum]